MKNWKETEKDNANDKWNRIVSRWSVKEFEKDTMNISEIILSLWEVT